jgi:hypothetical protein
MKTSINNILKFALLLLFVVYYGSITLFMHSHTVNGITISHSHPYKPFSDQNDESHSHTPEGFLVIQLLSGFMAITAFLYIVLAFFFPLVSTVLAKAYSRASSNNGICLAQLRAPPLNIHNPLF